MTHNVEFKNWDPDERTRELIERLIRKLERKTKSFPADEVFLRIMVEENSVRKLFHLSITLEIPGTSPATKKTLATQEERHDVTETIRDGFAEIEDQLDAYKSTLRGEPVWKRRARREELRRQK